jgi:glycosyltransferase involved in cell wall biosynthesis
MDSLSPVRDAGTMGAPQLAIVIPVYGHSVLMSEAIKSALAQDCTEDFAVILVNDGCRLEETHRLCTAFAALHPEKIIYLRRPNGGLSAARNTGIRFALKQWPSIAAVYLLDADNRLLPAALRRAYAKLKNNPDISWVYPNIDMFGIAGNYDYDGPYSPLAHTHDNLCEAGSLIARGVFEAGIWFDESMRLGYEDWEFWLQAAERGLKGENEPFMGFQYRRRAESMLAESGRVHDEIIAYVKRKHPLMFTPKALARLEAEYAPRYAIFDADAGRVAFAADPAAPGATMALADIDRLFWEARAQPHQTHFPPFIVVLNSQTAAALTRAALLRWAFWMLEQSLSEAPIAALLREQSSVKHTLEVTALTAQISAATLMQCTMLMIPTAKFLEALRDGTDWLDSLASAKPDMPVALTRVSLDDPAAGQPRAGDAQFLASLLTLIRHSVYRDAAEAGWNWRHPHVRPRRDNFEFLRGALGHHAVGYPILPKTSRNIGFLLPIAAFGGVEKVTYNVAAELKSKGWAVHLFVLGTGVVELPPGFSTLFETINILLDPDANRAAKDRSYLGVQLPYWAQEAENAHALGLLFWLDAVVNCHSSGASTLMGQLKKFGVTTLSHLHVIDRTALQMPTGHPMLALAYEHAYDRIICCSDTLARWMHGMGVPEEKLIVVRNGPGFPITDDDATAVITARDMDAAQLNCLYIGRFDRQKGLERLCAIVQRTKDDSPPVAWRIVGRSVLKDGDGLMAPLAGLIEPPAASGRAMLSRLGWAHVLVLPSHWEGMPLVVIEAMRCGAVVIATDVGAMREIITDGVDGFLVPNSAATADACTEIIWQLAINRDLLQTVSAAAAQTAQGFRWQDSIAPLQTYLESHTRTSGGDTQFPSSSR